MTRFHASLAAISVIAAFFLFNLINLKNYGRTYDEKSTYGRGRLSTAIIISFFNPSKPVSDADLMLPRECYHPHFYCMLLYHASQLFTKLLKMNLTESWHLTNLIFATVGLVFLFFLVRVTLGGEVAFFSVLFLISFPRFIAHAHYNSKDMPLMVLSILTMILFHRSLLLKTNSSAVLAGLSAGLSVSTSLFYLLLFPVFIAGYVIDWKDPIGNKPLNLSQQATKIRIFLITAFFVTYACWPLLWINPLHFFVSINRFFGHFFPEQVHYFGKYYSAYELPWHYTTLHLLMATPLPTLGLFAVGVFFAVKDISKKKRLLTHVMFLLWFLIPVLAKSIKGLARYNDIRHVLLSIPPLAIYAGWGLTLFLSKVRSHFPRWGKWLCPAIVFGIVAYSGAEIALVHPFEGLYFNHAVRILFPRHIEHHFDFFDWGSPAHHGINWLLAHAKPKSKIYFSLDIAELAKDEVDDRLVSTPACNADYYLALDRGLYVCQSSVTAIPIFAVERFNSSILLIYKGREPK